MGLWFWKRSKKGSDPDPLRAYDDALNLLARRADEVRRAAATLLVLRTDLGRQVERHRKHLGEIHAGHDSARRKGNDLAARVFAKDEENVSRLLHAAEESLARTEVDGALLTEAAGELREQLVQLRAEQIEAGTRLKAGEVSRALGRLTANVEWAFALELDKARDEVERAHALAEGYRVAHEKP